MTQSWEDLKVWLASHPFQAVIVFIGINFVGVFAGELAAGVAGGFVGFLVRGLFLTAAVAVGIAYLSGRWKLRR
ncbi:hypothetical protein [Rubrobacter indicoceani]|uniref:hypothetical protein n=1 Tax=Rubrobacter indicoceani TaxID=2051957 RepID=UPI000E5B8967|nr:hypothetical protein [Rubrobacter indicoceani]